jgi:hypothetical protein
MGHNTRPYLITISQAYFQFTAPELADDVLESYARTLFQVFDDSAEHLLPLPDYDLHLDVEEGSIKGKGTVWVTTAALVFGIGHFGSFVQGLREIHGLAKAVGDRLIQSAPQHLPTPAAHLTWSRSDSATVGRLLTLFREVGKGNLDPDSATQKAIELLQNGEPLSPQLLQDLKTAIRDVKQHKQLVLPFEEDFLPPETAVPPSKPKQRFLAGKRVALPPDRKVRIEDGAMANRVTCL